MKETILPFLSNLSVWTSRGACLPACFGGPVRVSCTGGGQTGCSPETPGGLQGSGGYKTNGCRDPLGVKSWCAAACSAASARLLLCLWAALFYPLSFWGRRAVFSNSSELKTADRNTQGPSDPPLHSRPSQCQLFTGWQSDKELREWLRRGVRRQGEQWPLHGFKPCRVSAGKVSLLWEGWVIVMWAAAEHMVHFTGTRPVVIVIFCYSQHNLRWVKSPMWERPIIALTHSNFVSAIWNMEGMRRKR